MSTPICICQKVFSVAGMMTNVLENTEKGIKICRGKSSVKMIPAYTGLRCKEAHLTTSKASDIIGTRIIRDMNIENLEK